MSKKSRLVIGSRGSRLALVQAEWVKQELARHFPQLEIAIRIVKTAADVKPRVFHSERGGIPWPPCGKQGRHSRRARGVRGDGARPPQAGGSVPSGYDVAGRKGFYTRAIEEELAAGTVDCAVHSMKDVPAELLPGFEIAAVTKRLDPRDVLISHRFARFDELPRGATVGTSSLRRLTQMKYRRPDLAIVPLRGNVETRLDKLERQGLDAIILAAAGLKRLGREQVITEYLDPAVMIPAAGQGMLAIEVRAGDDAVRRSVLPLNDPVAAAEATAERTFLRRLSGGCQVPISAYAASERGGLTLAGFVADPKGVTLLRDEVKGTPAEAEKLGERLADRLLSQGAQPLIDQILGHGQR